MKLDQNALQAATEAYTAEREAGTPIIDTFPALITAYIQHAGKGVEGDDDDRTLASACRKYNIGSVSRLDEIIATLRALQYAGEAEPVALTAYEAQVLIGTSISGCVMPRDRAFDLSVAWTRLQKLGLIDRADGLAVATPEGLKVITSMLAASPSASEGWQPIETAPKDGRSLAVWVADSEITPHVFSPVSITADGGWWDDSIGDQIEPIAGATHWLQITPPASPSKQASTSADQGGE